MALKFKNGDKVMLKSGSPIMTIDGFSLWENRYSCKWFDEQDNYNANFFSEDSIELVERDEQKKEIKPELAIDLINKYGFQDKEFLKEAFKNSAWNQSLEKYIPVINKMNHVFQILEVANLHKKVEMRILKIQDKITDKEFDKLRKDYG